MMTHLEIQANVFNTKQYCAITQGVYKGWNVLLATDSSGDSTVHVFTGGIHTW